MISTRKTLLTHIKARADVFFHSTAYLVIVFAVAALGLTFNQEVVAIFVLLVLAVVSWLLVEDILPSFALVAVMGLIGLRIPREGLYHFVPLYYTPIFVVPAFIVKLFIQPFRFVKGRFFYPTLAVAIAVTLGGLFVISWDAYFAGATIFHTATLGVGMVIVYFIVERYLITRPSMGDDFARMMVAVGAVGAFMLAQSYVARFDALDDFTVGAHFQWRNNLSNMLLMSMPFAFYLALKSKYPGTLMVIGTLQYVALVFSFSRGGIVFGTIMFPLVVGTTWWFGRHLRLHLMAVLSLFAGYFLYVMNVWLEPVHELVDRLEIRIRQATDNFDYSRWRLMRYAWENFMAHPIFGTGLGMSTADHGYNPATMSMNWYHSTVAQVIGSTGIVGILAYGYQEWVRIKTMVARFTPFNAFVGLSFLGFASYSLVNVGYHAPFFVALFLTMFVVLDRVNQQGDNL